MQHSTFDALNLRKYHLQVPKFLQPGFVPERLTFCHFAFKYVDLSMKFKGAFFCCSLIIAFEGSKPYLFFFGYKCSIYKEAAIY